MTNMENFQPHFDMQTGKTTPKSYAELYREGYIGDGMYCKVCHAAKLVCIAFAFVMPCILVWTVLL